MKTKMETAEAVVASVERGNTPLKRGVNENRASETHKIAEKPSRTPVGERLEMRRRSGVLSFGNPPPYVVRSYLRRSAGVMALAGLLLISLAAANAKEIKLLNVSYDPTRELYQDFNTAFSKYWEG